MADKSIPKLESVTTPTSEDLAIIVTDVSSAPANKKSTLATFFNKIPTWLGLSTTPIVYTTGEIDVTTPVSFLSVTGSTTFSLPAGTIGQIKMLVCTVAASTPLGVLTPVASSNDGYDTITFNEVGQSVTLIYSNSSWIMLSAKGFRDGNADVMILEDDVTLDDASVSLEFDAIKAEDASFRIALQDTIPSNFASNQSLTDATDIVFNQFDAKEVARIHDGAVVPTVSGSTYTLSAGTGFGFRRRILTLSAGGGNNLTLTAADSGAIIYVTPTEPVDLILPLVGTETGIWFEIIFAAKVNKAFEIKTSGQDGNDNITLMNQYIGPSQNLDVGGSDHDVLYIANANIGTRIEIINCVGGDGERWHAYVRSLGSQAATIS